MINQKNENFRKNHFHNKNIPVNGSLTKKNRVFIRDNLVTDEKIDEFIELLSKGKFEPEDKEQLLQTRKFITKLVEEYEDVFNDVQDKIPIDNNSTVDETGTDYATLIF
jgi:hypothetical protein